MGYGLRRRILPVWLLLAPRDYLSAFVKIGVVVALAVGVFIVLPPLQMPALTRFVDGNGPGVRWEGLSLRLHHDRVRRDLRISRADRLGHDAQDCCSARPDARMIGYGAMLTESLVAVLALIAACALTPGVYFAINAPASALGTTAESAAHAIRAWGFTVAPGADLDRSRIRSASRRCCRAPGARRASRSAWRYIFSGSLGSASATAMALWYHFAIMFEALFLLTTLDAGTRVGRFMLQDSSSTSGRRSAAYRGIPAVVFSSALFVAHVGTLSLSGHHRPARRDQFALAAVRHLQPAARERRALCRHDGHHQDGQGAIRVDHCCCRWHGSIVVTDRRLAEDLLARTPHSDSWPTPGTSMPPSPRGTCRPGYRIGGGRYPRGVQRPPRRGGRRIFPAGRGGDRDRIGARVAASGAWQDAPGID